MFATAQTGKHLREQMESNSIDVVKWMQWNVVINTFNSQQESK